MKRKYIALAFAISIGVGSVFAKSYKRGVSENEFQYKAQLEALSPGVTWYYNWANVAGNYVANTGFLEFVPMCWNANYNADKIRQFVKDHPETKYILGYNEPNFNNQAHMTPEQAAQDWPNVVALARELNLEIVAPALNYSPHAPYQDPLKWMDEFVALVGSDAFDYTAVHSYGGFGNTQTLATNFHDKYGKPVWVTEFCYWPGENGNSYISPDSQIGCMIQTLEWMEKTDWIHRYAWFKAIGASNESSKPNYGLLISGKAENPRELSEQGKVYVYLTDFDKSVYNHVDKWISAANIIAQNLILLGSNQDPSIDAKLEITRFNAGAYADYQFECNQKVRNFRLRVAGFGEPTRFDPVIGIFTVDENGNELAQIGANTKLTLKNSDTDYEEVIIPVSLEAGRHTIRVKDMGPTQPSGMKISAVMLDAGYADVKAANIDASTQNVNVYNLQGILLRQRVAKVGCLDPLPAGIYIVDGKKMRKQ